MVTLGDLVRTVEVTLALFVLWYLIFFCIRPYRVEALRQRLFAVRDNVFDYVAAQPRERQSSISFEDRAYVYLRRSLNAFIRYADRLTLTHLLLSYVACPKPRRPVADRAMAEWEDALNALPSESRQVLRAAHSRAMALVTKHILTGSPVLWPVALMLWLDGTIAVKRGIKTYRWEPVNPGLRRQMDRVEVQAINVREYEDAVAVAQQRVAA